MQIDVFHDLICPWCFIGKNRLAQALQQCPGLDVDIIYRPVLIESDTPPEGLNREDYLVTQFGSKEDGEAELSRIEEIGLKEGIHFQLNKRQHFVNSMNPHRLALYAMSRKADAQVVEALFHAYFVHSDDISDIDVLSDIGAACGLNRKLVHKMLESDHFVKDVQTADAVARQVAIEHVPTYVFDSVILIQGTQEVNELAHLIKRTAERV